MDQQGPDPSLGEDTPPTTTTTRSLEPGETQAAPEKLLRIGA